jgi:hypothetical protein
MEHHAQGSFLVGLGVDLFDHTDYAPSASFRNVLSGQILPRCRPHASEGMPEAALVRLNIGQTLSASEPLVSEMPGGRLMRICWRGKKRSVTEPRSLL